MNVASFPRLCVPNTIVLLEIPAMSGSSLLPLWNTQSFTEGLSSLARKIYLYVLPIPRWRLLGQRNCRKIQFSHFVNGPTCLILRRDWLTFKFHIARCRDYDSIWPIHLMLHRCWIERSLLFARLSHKDDFNLSAYTWWVRRRVWWCLVEISAFPSCGPFSNSLLRWTLVDRGSLVVFKWRGGDDLC